MSTVLVMTDDLGVVGGRGGGGGVGFAVSFFMILSKFVAPWGLPII